MKPNVLLLATGAEARWKKLVADYAASAHDVQLTVLDRTAATSAWQLRGEIAKHAPRVIGADTPLEHHAALLYKAFAPHPVAVLKTRFDAQPLDDTRWNRWVHCKLTGVNLLWTRADESVMRGTKGALHLDRPFVLTQDKLGEQSPLKMLDHAVRGLTQPSRASLTGDKRDHSRIGLTYITHFYLNQNSTVTIFDLLRKYAAYAPDVLDRVQFVIVDDGSPLKYEIPADLGLNLTWLKVRQDIPWNQAGARNLGVTYAKSDKILITDLDHVFPEATLRHLVEHANCGRRVYKFWRVTPESPGKLKRGHPNIFFLSRARYFELYGYDEEFAGGYGAEDFRFMKWQKVHGSLSPHLPRRYFCVENEKIDRKKAYHSLTRDHSFNTPVDLRKQYESQWHGSEAGHSRMFLNFEWDVLARAHRPPSATPWPVKKWWKPLWFLRAILPRW